MAKRRVVKITKDGSLLAVETLSERICQILEETLSYTKIIHLRGDAAYHAKKKIDYKPVSCFRYVKDPDKAFPTRMIVLSGFLSKIAGALKRHGYVARVRDARPHPRPAAFEPRWDRLSDVEFKWMQRTILGRILKTQYGQIKCPPGYGKSFMIYCLAKLLPKASFAVSTHSVDVLEQIHDELALRLPDVGMCSGRTKRGGNRVTCYSGKSLHHCDKDVDFLLVDEVHEWATDDYLEKTSSGPFRFARRFGFSASIGDRPDKADFELEGVFGPLIVDLSYQKCVEHGCVTPIEVHWRDVVMDFDPAEGYKDPIWQERAAIWQNETRNEQIAADARSFDDDEQVLITVETIEHLMYLKRLLPEFKVCYSPEGLTDEDRDHFIEEGCITGQEPIMTLARRHKMKKAFEHRRIKKVIATSVWKRGVDFKALQVLIRADGKASPISDMQIPGRTSRLCDETGKTVSIVIDYRDQFNQKWRRRGTDRRSNYKGHGWRQVDPEVKSRRRRKRDDQKQLF